MARHGSVNPNKFLKEQFVSNLTGSSMLEISALSTIVPALVVLRQWCGFCYVADENRPKKDDNVTMVDSVENWRAYMISLVVDYVFIILPILSVFTVFADLAYLCAISLIFLLLFCFLAKRRYAKTETYGTGLMDLGVGSFVLANALVSRQARYSTSGKWKAAIQSTSPLIFLGFVRLVFTKGVDYQVHVGEYGVHWNFFFTLAAVSVLTSSIKVHPRYCGVFGLFILAVYQICLIYGLNNYLLSNERALNIISLNKEGIFSIFGYWGLYLVGVHLGYNLFFKDMATGTVKDYQRARDKVWSLSVMFWLLTIILDEYVERVSRRMCNLAYVTLVLAQNFQVLSILLLSHLIPGQKSLVLEEAFNQNLLGVFLLANILTGMINLLVDTLSASSLAAFGILSGYILVLSVLAGLAKFFRIKLKFW